jgi:hypothetical protein
VRAVVAGVTQTKRLDFPQDPQRDARPHGRCSINDER